MAKAAGLLPRLKAAVLQGQTNEQLATPLLETRHKKFPLVSRNGELNVETRGLPKTFLYWGDMFHTLVNMPNLRFAVVLLCTYFLLFSSFAVPFYYDGCHNSCIPGVQSFSHAFWFSVQTSMTIGYGGDLTPDPNCTLTNILVITQSFASLIIAYSLLGVFYARFSLPTRRAQTFLFSKRMVFYQEDGVFILAFRMANMRKHQIIEANVRLLVRFNNLVADDDNNCSDFISLPVLGGSEVFLGLPCLVKHPITSSSLLHGLTLKEMNHADLEFLVLLEGVDASTSSKLQARYSYLPADISENFHFEPMVFRLPSGRHCVDFAKFDSISPLSGCMDSKNKNSFSPAPSLTLPMGGLCNLSDDVLQGDWSHMPNLESKDGPRFHAPLAHQCSSVVLGGLGKSVKNNQIVSENPIGMRKAKSSPDLVMLSSSSHSQHVLESDLQERVSKAEATARVWKTMLIELSCKVLHTLDQHPQNVGTEQLVSVAKCTLSHALLSS